MEEDIQLPYFRNPELLPAPLPTIDDIRMSRAVLKGGEMWSSRKVVIVGEHFLVKYGEVDGLLEGKNLLFIEKHLPQVSAPRLYAMWQESSKDAEFVLVMELIHGDTLESRWQCLTDIDKSLVLGNLRRMFDSMRSLPSPGFFGNVTRGPLPHPLFWSSDSAIMRPFETGRDIICALAKKSRMNWELNQRHSYLADFYEKCLASRLDNSQPTFSHSDLQPKNIIIKEIHSENSLASHDFQVSIVDWELAGWYPRYWEYVAAFLAFTWEDNWSVKIAECIDTWPAEASMMRLIHQDLWF